MAEHVFIGVENQLTDLAAAVREGRELPDIAVGVLEAGAAIVRKHGMLLVRLKAALGPNLVFAAEQDELIRREVAQGDAPDGEARDRRVFAATRHFMRDRKPRLACAGA